MNRDRAYYRYQRKRHIQRKIHILKLWGSWYVEAWTRNQPGRLAKGKIHCSCRMCRTKSYDGWSQSDKRDILSGKQQISEWLSRETEMGGSE